MAILQNIPNAMTADIVAACQGASRAIPPAWPLAATVAVNPFLGQSGEDLATASARLARVSGASATMPRSWYHAKIQSGEILDADLQQALANAPGMTSDIQLSDLKRPSAQPVAPIDPLPTIADLASKASQLDWPAIIDERFGSWAASFADEGQAFWITPPGSSAYASWRSFAMHDLTPEIIGLKGFASFIAQSPETADQAIMQAMTQLTISADAAESYFHRLFMTLGGWAQLARYRLWMAELGGSNDTTMTDFLAIRLLWEAALHAQYKTAVDGDWDAAMARYREPLAPSRDQIINALLQDAAECADQRRLAAILANDADMGAEGRPTLQAAFCIDVRSEVFRRALESVDTAIETFGFAGFFGLTVSHRRFASDTAELRLPVLLNPGLESRSGTAQDAGRDQASRVKARAKRAWGRFKLAAVSSFAFVEATGPFYLGKLLLDSLGRGAKTASTDPAPHLVHDLTPDQALTAAETILRAMSLTQNFARLVVLAGHGANVTNNPHESALHCGACGGYSGEVNARLLASLLNDQGVRAGLHDKGITIPEDTWFLAALHDTTTDAVQLYTDDGNAPSHQADIEQARQWFAEAGKRTRTERAIRLPRAHNQQAVVSRSRDWSEVRPEWGLAGCSAFIAAPRMRTVGKDLGGRSFLHSYDWKSDTGFSILELILTAPVVVGSWISLQYYGSTVAPEIFGGGNKLLHNVVAGVGVFEGNGGQLRTGLPWQSVHDGEKFMHDPLRMAVCIEAPTEAMTDILERHPGVRALFDNRWLHLIALDDSGRMAARYMGDLEWQPMTRTDAESENLYPVEPPILIHA